METGETRSNRPRWWRRLFAAWPVRTSLALSGLALLGYGTVLAWRAEAATPILVAGVLLVALALFASEWGEIRATYPGGEVALLRGVRDAVETVATFETEEELRARLGELEQGLEALTAERRTEKVRADLARKLAEVTMGARRSGSPSPHTDLLYTRLAGNEPIASSLVGEAAVTLMLTISSGSPAPMKCVVIDAQGRPFESKLQTSISVLLAPRLAIQRGTHPVGAPERATCRAYERRRSLTIRSLSPPA